MTDKHHTIKNFSLNLPHDDPDVRDVAKLLEHLAENLRDFDEIDIQDIVFHAEGLEEDQIPFFTVYYHLKD